MILVKEPERDGKQVRINSRVILVEIEYRVVRSRSF